jgi:hypothetical protein
MASPTPDELRAMLRQKRPAPPPQLLAKTEQLADSVPPSDQNGALMSTEQAHGPPLRAQLRQPRRPQNAVVDVVLAEARQIEQAVAAALYQYPNQCVPRFIEKGLPEFFVDSTFRRFYELLHDYFLEHKHADPNAFLQHLDDVGQLAALGGPLFVGTLLHEVSPPGASFDYHIEILRDKYVAREATRRAAELSQKVLRADGDELWSAISEHEAAMAGLRALAADKLEGVETYSHADMVAFDPLADTSSMLGAKRWLGRGYTCLWAGGSGYGKSTLEMQAALYWATGTRLFGIRPVRPLKSLIIQAENDLGDISEQFQGVLAGIRATGDVVLNGQVERMVTIVRLIGATGDKFLSRLAALLRLHKPDLVWIDPLFAFAGCDLIDTEAISHFFRDGLIPLVVEHGVCAHVIHHIGKPQRDNDAKKGWTSFDYQFLGFGSSEIQNSFRAVNILIPVSGHEGVFKLILSKRGDRAGAKDTEGNETRTLFLSHSKLGGMLWTQVPVPDDEDAPKQKRNTDSQFQNRFSPDSILSEMSVLEGQSAADLQRVLKTESGMSEKTFYRLWAQLKTTGKIKIGDERKWFIKTT